MTNFIVPIIAGLVLFMAQALHDRGIIGLRGIAVITAIGLVYIISYYALRLFLKWRGRETAAQFLDAGGFDRLYRSAMSAVLGWFDRHLCPPEYLNVYDPHYRYPPSGARAWNWRAYDRMLLIAVAYPLLLPLLIWVFAATPAMLGQLEIMPAPETWWQQPLVAAGLLAIVFSRPIARRIQAMLVQPLANTLSRVILARPAPPEFGRDLVQGALILAIAFGVAATVAFAFAGAGAVAFAIVGASAGLVVLAFAGEEAFALAGAIAVAVVGAFTGATAVTGYVALGVAGAGAFAIGSAAEWSVGNRKHPALAYVLLTAFLATAFIITAHFIPLDNLNRGGTLLLFLGLFPLLNAIWDFVSLGLTRWALRQSLLTTPWRGLPAWTRPLVFNLLDALGAIVALVCLSFSLLAGVALLNHLAADPILPLTRVFTDLRPGPGGPNMTWLYIMVFSTLLPTLAHLLLFLISLALRYPAAPGRRVMAAMLGQAENGDGRTAFVCAILALQPTLWIGAPLLIWVYAPPHTAGLHDRILATVINLIQQGAVGLGLM